MVQGELTMKKLKTTKKLSLETETLAAIQSGALDAVLGGAANLPTVAGCQSNVGGQTCFLCIPDPVK